MGEVINKVYIENQGVKDCNEFSDDLIKEGKSIYEVIRIIKGKPLFFEEHMKRFKNSCSLEKKEMILGDDGIKDKIYKLIEVNGVTEGNVKIIFNYRENGNISLFYFIKHSYPTEEMYLKGVDTILYFGERTNPNAKVINSTFKSMVEKKIKENNAYEAILVDNQGFITEGSRSNIFMVKGESIITSPLDMVLPGVTRGIIIEIVKKCGIHFREQRINYKEITELQGLFISGTSPQVLPISKVDNHTFSSNENLLVKKIMDEYNNRVNDYIDESNK
jgi:branched-chain amino acid aminotransferase